MGAEAYLHASPVYSRVVLSLADVERARARIAPHIRETRLVRLTRTPRTREDIPLVDPRIDRPIWLKLECEQASGSFKARGALNCILALDEATKARGIVTASGGNHGLAVAFAGAIVGARTVVYLPRGASADKAARIASWGAEVVRGGDDWDEAHAAATKRAVEEGATYIHPFADLGVIAGQGTIALEVPDADLFVVAIGGGGLISGIATTARLTHPKTRIVGVEPEGAPTMQRSVIAGRVVTLDAVRTAAGTLAPRATHARNLELVEQHVEAIVLVSDEEMREATRFLLKEVGVGVELSAAAAVAAVLAGRVDLGASERPCILVCGAGSDAIG